MSESSDTISVKHITDAFRKAVDLYEVKDGVEQRDLKPLTVLAVDYLMPLVVEDKSVKPYICMNAMKADPDRTWVSDNLQNLRPHHEECMVDLNVMTGDTHPYNIILTAESEAYADDARLLSVVNEGEVEDSDMLWDLYKLLMVPSPIRLFVTQASIKHHGSLLKHTTRLANCYAPTIGDATTIFAVQIPTTSLRRDKTLIARWGPGRLRHEPEQQYIHLADP
jgi:hypothetical protein